MKLVHSSYHKCLTVYYSRVMSSIYNRLYIHSKGYMHFNSLIDDFYREIDRYKVASVNNHVVDVAKLGSDFRLTRFIRDPRDLVVSGYFYHLKGSEDWCNIVDPKPEDLAVVNGVRPAEMKQGESYSSFLKRLSTEDGLCAEIEFRKKHFQSMSLWPMDDERIKVFRYEDIVNNELAVFDEIFNFYELSWITKKIGRHFVQSYSAKAITNSAAHIRNAKPSQWKDQFTPKVQEAFDAEFKDTLGMYGYQ